MKIIFTYSAIKIIAKDPPEYSVLNPDTNSLSPSAKSKGVRLVSATVVVNQIYNKIGHNKHIIMLLYINIMLILNDWWNSKHEIRINDILTS